MLVKFYQTKSQANELTKELTLETNKQGHLKSDCDMVNPEITFDLDNNILVFNYCYISAFQRYYFIDDVNIINGMMVVRLHCDVLMSFKEDILASVGTITRTNAGDNYIPDNLILPTKKIKRQCQKIGVPFTKLEKFVVQIGG